MMGHNSTRILARLCASAAIVLWLAGHSVFGADTGLMPASNVPGESMADVEREKNALDNQRHQITEELAKAGQQAEEQRQRALEDAEQHLEPAGLSIIAPPAPEGEAVFSIRADQVPFKNVLICLARKARIAVHASMDVSEKILDTPITADLRFASMAETLEVLCGILGLGYRAGRDSKGAFEILVTASSLADAPDKRQWLQNKAVETYTGFILRYPTDPLASEAYYQIGEIHFAQNEFALAAQDFKQLLQPDPKSKLAAPALVKLGRCYSELGDYETASKVLYDFLDRAPEPAQAAEALLAIGRSAAKAGQTEESLRAYGRLLLGFPAIPAAADARFEAAMLLSSERDYEKALGYYALLAKDHPEYKPREVRYQAALCKMKLEQWSAAASDFAALVTTAAKDSISAESYYRLAQCLDGHGGDLAAVEAYVGAVSRFPSNSAAPAARARIVELYRKTGLVDRAISYAEQALKQLEPGEAERTVKSQLAAAFLEDGQNERALKLFEEVAQADAAGISRAEALIGAADAARKLPDYDRAEVLYRGALAASPDAAQKRRALRGLGDTCVARGDYARAASAYAGLQAEEEEQ